MDLKKIVNAFKFPRWTNWGYVNENSCVQVRTDLNKNSTPQARTVHDWTEQYIEEGSCMRVKTCNRCGETREEIGEVHPSYNPQYGTYSEQICSRCGKQLDGFMNC